MQRYEKHAAIVLALTLMAIVLLAVVFQIPDGPTGEQISNAAGGDVEQQSDDRHPPIMARTSEFSFYGDSLAQWSMAFFSMLATVVSIYAVMLVNRTLKTSRRATQAAIEAVSVTREIGVQQLRPYILYEAASYEVLQSGDGSIAFLEIEVAFRNCGMSPGIITAASSAVYAPTGRGTWGQRRAGYHPCRIAIGPGQVEKTRFQGINREHDGTLTWFTIGILIWYDAIDGNSYEDHVWLTFDGADFRQDFHDMGRDLYRPEHNGNRD